MLRTWLAITIALLTVSALADDPPAPRRVTLKFGHQEPEPFNPQRWLLSPEVVADKDGTVRLARSVLETGVIGQTDHHQRESLSDRVWSRTSFRPVVLEAELKQVTKVELFVYGAPKQIEFNDAPLADAKPHVSTGWTRGEVSVSALRSFGDRRGNQVVFKGGGTLLFEQESGRSEKSTDGGKTWSSENLGANGNATGTYLARLRLGIHDRQGTVQSPVIDLWSIGDADIARRGETGDLRFPDLSHVALRSGSTPLPDAQHWTAWGNRLQTPHHRWVQFRMEITDPLYGTGNVQIPKVFRITYDFRPEPPTKSATLEVSPPAGRFPRLTSVPFIYEKHTPRLKHLCEQYQLDKVIAPGKTEMEHLMLLRHWVRNQWHTAWGTHAAAWMPPWDALQILGCKDQPDCLTMCTHYACVFTQCCLALGWNARHCILDHHCVAEVWVDQHQKWVMMDSGNSPTRPDCNLHFERNGVPQSALELHLAYRDKKTEGIVVCFTPKALMEAIAPLCRKPPVAHAPGSPRPETVPLAELKNFPVCGLENYRRYAFPGRNNYLTSLYPGELYQGWAEYFYDGYWWVGDERDDPQLSPEYSKHLPPSRPQDIDWDLNWSRIHLCRTAKAGELQVDLETLTPNLARLEMSTEAGDKAAWKATPAAFVWKLQPGKNVLRARGVNAWDRAGKPAEVIVEWKAQ